MEATRQHFIGRGWAFPLGTDVNGGIRTVGGAEEIEQAIYLILSTTPGERPMRPEFGCGLADFVFESITPATFGRIASAVEQALDRWEPRIDVDDVVVGPDPDRAGAVLIEVVYRIRDTYDRRSLVVPFYVIPEHQEV
ncbi:MAG: GPW/gp25 family protein [Actinomycetota bacterium]